MSGSGSAYGSKNRTSEIRFEKILFFISAIALSLLLCSPAFSQSWGNSTGDQPPYKVPQGADGVSFLPVPMDTSINCNSVILRGTQRFQGTAFVLPRVVISQNKEKETLFEVLQTGTDKYLLRFAVYFPRTNDELFSYTIKSPLLVQGCDFDNLLGYLNRKGIEANQKINSLARVPISSVDVRIDGINKAYTLGGVEASILQYQGVDHVVEFPISSRAQLDSILQRIEGNIGLGVHVAMKFNARAGDGALYADVDLSALAGALQAGIGARKLIATGELQALIGANLQKIGMNVQTESGNSQVFAMASEQIMQMIVQGLVGNSGYNGGWDNNSGGNNGPFGNGSIFNNGNNNGGWDPSANTGSNSPFLTPPQSQSSTAKPSQQIDLSQALSDTDMVQVAAVLQLLRTKKNQRIRYENMGPSEQQVYNTSVIFRGEIDDPDVRAVNVVSGKENARILPNRLNKGNGFTLSAATYTAEKLTYKQVTTYFTEAQVKSLKLQSMFKLLQNERLLVRDQTLRDGIVGTMKEAPQWNPFNFNFYVWGQTELVSNATKGQSREIELTPEAVAKLPIAVTFSRVGLRKFSLGDLLAENELWKGSWDNLGGRISFTAKSNLGQMTIYNLEQQRTANTLTKVYFQERRNRTKTLSTYRFAVTKSDVPVARSTVKLLITNAAAVGEVIATITPTPMTSGDNTLFIPSPQ